MMLHKKLHSNLINFFKNRIRLEILSVFFKSSAGNVVSLFEKFFEIIFFVHFLKLWKWRLSKSYKCSQLGQVRVQQKTQKKFVFFEKKNRKKMSLSFSNKMLLRVKLHCYSLPKRKENFGTQKIFSSLFSFLSSQRKEVLTMNEYIFIAF